MTFHSQSLLIRSTLLAAVLVVPLQSQNRFPAVDRNEDGMISRSEWEGTARAFDSYDENRDGLISGTELPPGFEQDRDRRYDRSRARTSAGKLDRNASGVIEGYEWPYNSKVFHELDADGDSVLSPQELKNITSLTLNDLDANGNRQIEADEWPGGFAKFDRLDANRDGKVSASEYFQNGGEWQRRQRFEAWDKNRDGILQSTEWQTSAPLFHRLDTNGDSQVSWNEFMASQDRYERPFGWRSRQSDR